ncbi:MAG: hypothetical protein EB034_24880, partial [Verrucomicrobia bacterium]|nr:hypothetical protein [Verrucomicrobiota bacterium]
MQSLPLRRSRLVNGRLEGGRDELPRDAAVAGFAGEPAFFLREVVVCAPGRAATIRREHGVREATLGSSAPALIHSDSDLIKRAKDKPGTVSQANGGTGTSNHLVSELFQMLTDTKFILVPYQGGGPAMTSVISAQTESYFDQASTSVSPAQSGRVRVLGLTSKTRWAPMPDVPTFIESGVKDFVIDDWVG